MIRRILLFALILAHSPLPAPAPRSCKPTAPIDLDARLVGDPTGPFTISAKATSALGPVDLDVVLPDGVTAEPGQRQKFGPRSELKLNAVARDRTRREIVVRASVTQGGATLTKVVPLVLFDAPAPKAATKKNSRGETIVEYGP